MVSDWGVDGNVESKNGDKQEARVEHVYNAELSMNSDLHQLAGKLLEWLQSSKVSLYSLYTVKYSHIIYENYDQFTGVKTGLESLDVQVHQYKFEALL